MREYLPADAAAHSEAAGARAGAAEAAWRAAGRACEGGAEAGGARGREAARRAGRRSRAGEAADVPGRVARRVPALVVAADVREGAGGAADGGPSADARAGILDVGSGPGPAAIAAVDLLGGEATCFDLSEEALAEARALGVRETVREMPAKEFDLTLAANVLSELPDAIDLVRKLRGIIVIVEPGLRETSRALLRLRDQILTEGTHHALAPCLTQKPCPALASAK